MSAVCRVPQPLQLTQGWITTYNRKSSSSADPLVRPVTANAAEEAPWRQPMPLYDPSPFNSGRFEGGAFTARAVAKQERRHRSA